jgi:orotate phosphoribosyltransferase
MAQKPSDKTSDVLEPGDPRFARLKALIMEHSFKTGDFTLSSGRKSTYMFQLRQTTMLPEGQFLFGTIMVDHMQRLGLTTVGGLEMGAVPLVTACSFASHITSYPVDAFFVRKAAKTHGARERIDGHVKDGADVLIVDDVATSGNSVIGAIEGLKSEYPNCTVRHALVGIDREEGAREMLAERGIKLAAIFRKSDFPI